MRKIFYVICALIGLQGYGQSRPDIVLKVIPSAATSQYKDQVEFKAYLYNKSRQPINIVNPNYTEPAWRLYKDEWLVLDASGKKVNPPGFMDGASSRFEEKDVTIIKPGDSLYVRYFKYRFETPGTFTVKYVLDQNPEYSSYYKNKKGASTLTVFRAESNELPYTINKPQVAEVKAGKVIPVAEVWKQKKYKSLAEAFANADSVYRLEVDGIKQEDFNNICKLRNLRSLSVSGAQIDSFPAAFNELNLTSLSLILSRGYEKVPPIVIPKAIGKMTEMEVFSIHNAQEVIFPEEFGNLHALSQFSTLYCQYEKLPASFGNLKKLQVFTIRRNEKLTALPAGFINFTDLRMLEVSDCALLTTFPAVFGAMSLSSIDLQKNSITAIPADIAGMKGLNYLVMEDNKLISLPAQLAELPALRMLNVRGNAIAVDDNMKKVQAKLGKSFFK